MIKLNRSNIEDIMDEYVAKILPEIALKIQHEVLNSNYQGILIQNGEINEALIKDLLTKPLNEVVSKYPEIRELYCLGSFLLSSNFKEDYAHREFKKDRKRLSRKVYRENFVNRFNSTTLDLIKRSNVGFQYNNNNFEKFLKEVSSRLENDNFHFDRIIDYKILQELDGGDFRHKLIASYELEVCPYCNRQYISNYEKKSFKKTTADLDHFYPKSIFPFFSLSLYNFVPSCLICNSRFKLAKKIDLLYPFDEGFSENAKFTIVGDNVKYSTLIGSDDEFEIDFNVVDCESKSKIINNIETFKLKELYANHKNEVKRTIAVKNAYSESYKEYFNEMFDEMKLNETDINLFLYGISNRYDNLSEKPLSKLIYDLVNE